MKNIQYGFLNSNQDSYVFYKFNEDSKDEHEQFEIRVKKSNFCKCYVNSTNDFENKKIISLSTEEFNQMQEQLLREVYPIEWDKIKVFGVTGTNGKTTTVHITNQLARKIGMNVLSIGTLGVFYNDKIVDNYSLTTPSGVDIWKLVYDHQGKLDCVLMELSSHALAQDRINGILFDNIGWTSFSQDHLDYHVTLENYLNSKLKVLNMIKEKNKLLVAEGNKTLIEVLKSKNVDFKECEVVECKNNFFNIEYNQQNLAVATGFLNENFVFKMPSLDFLSAPPGRYNIYSHKNSYIIIDFAHSPDALKNLLSEVKKTYKDFEVITIFGCGGNRDKSKRVIMGNIARKLSDKVIITSDNPRDEDPLQIIKDIQNGHEDVFEVSRELAIKKGFSMLDKSILLIAGKGHEETIEINGEKVPFSDSGLVLELMEND